MKEDAAPVKRGRGRPRKVKKGDQPAKAGSGDSTAPKRGRGRPPARVVRDAGDEADGKDYEPQPKKQARASKKPAAVDTDKPKKGRGRPRKNPPAADDAEKKKSDDNEP